MRTTAILAVLAVVTACQPGGTSPTAPARSAPASSAPVTGRPPTVTPTVTPPATPPAEPSPTLDTSLFGPLPEVLAGIPLGGGPSAEISAETQRRLAPDPTVGHPFELGHCGLLGPVEFDGSLWVAEGTHNGVGGPLSQDQVGELINPTPVRLFLLDDRSALLVTPLNGFVLLRRHDGPREYALCD